MKDLTAILTAVARHHATVVSDEPDVKAALTVPCVTAIAWTGLQRRNDRALPRRVRPDQDRQWLEFDVDVGEAPKISDVRSRDHPVSLTACSTAANSAVPSPS